MDVKLLNIDRAHESILPELKDTFAKVISSNQFILGDQVTNFENEFAQFTGAKYCVGVANGLDALKLIFLGYGIGPGDEVIVPAHTFIATWLAVSDVGAKIIPVEVDETSCLVTVDNIQSALSEKTKAIVLVHLYGAPFGSIQELRKILKNYPKVKVIEDAAQAHGATVAQDRFSVGSLGDSAAFSFYPGKNLGALGDAGAITTSDADLFESVLRLRNYGSKVKYHHDLKGFNSRLDTVQAAFLSVKLKILSMWNERRQAIANHYSASFQSLGLKTQRVMEGTRSVWHIYSLFVAQRESLRQALKEEGIETGVHYPVACHRSGAYKNDFVNTQFSISENLAATQLSLPMCPFMTDSEVEKVVEVVRKVFRQSNS